MTGRGTPGPAVTPSGFFVLRTPLLPFTEITAWGDGLQAPAAAGDPGVLDQAVAADRAQLRRRLEDIVTTPEFRDALFVASPGLAAAADHDPRLRADLDYRPNSSLYQVGDRLLFAEASQSRSGRSYRLVAVAATPYLLQTLARARDGARLGTLAAALAGDDITRADADEYIAELAASQVLVADIRPQLTGAPPADTLATALRRHERTAGLAHQLGQAAAELAAIDTDGIGVPAERYRTAAAVLDGLPAAPDLPRFVQVDLMKPGHEVTLGADVVTELLRGVEILHALTRYRGHEGLRQFREQFTQRYETREVPLALALDEENGIGFERSGSPAAEAAPLLAGLPLGRGQDQSASWTRRDAFLLGKLTRALTAGSSEITVEASEAAAVRASDIPPLPDAFEVLAAVVAGGETAPGHGDFQVVLHSASGPSGARLLGRFCHADDQLRQLVRAHLAAEEAAHPERAFAEV